TCDIPLIVVDDIAVWLIPNPSVLYPNSGDRASLGERLADRASKQGGLMGPGQCHAHEVIRRFTSLCTKLVWGSDCSGAIGGHRVDLADSNIGYDPEQPLVHSRGPLTSDGTVLRFH